MDSSPSLKQLVQQGWKYHRATFDLYLWLGGTEWSQAAIEQVMLPELSRLAAADRGAFESELRVRKVSVDLAGTRLTDNALAAFLASWPRPWAKPLFHLLQGPAQPAYGQGHVSAWPFCCC